MNTGQVKTLLSIDTNAKTVKGQSKGYLTGILYLAPYTVANGKDNLCPNAENAGCSEACLYSAGRGKFNNVQQSRINKTNLWLNDKETFFNILIKDINKLIKKADKLGLVPCVRLNGTSDIVWQKELFNGLTIFEYFPDLQFYDYTKIPQKVEFDNYHLTFSYSQASSKYQSSIEKAYRLGMSFAVVFFNKFPNIFLGREVINGDENDLRFLDKPKTVIALKAKGSARKDSSGFVQDANIIPTF